MDPEQTFLRVHARLSGMLARLLTPRLRAVLEHLILLFAITLLGLLAVMHVNFVDQPGCAKEFSGNESAQVPLLRIKVTGYGLWSTQDLNARKQSESGETLQLNGEGRKRAGKSWLNWMGAIAWRSKAGKKIVKIDRTTDASTGRAKTLPESISYKPLGRQTETSRRGVSEAAGWPFYGPTRGALGTGLMLVWDRWISNAAIFLEIIKQTIGGFWRIGRIAGRELLTASSKDEFNEIFWNGFESTLVHWLEKRSEAFEPVYIYSVEKGYLILSEVAKFQHNVHTLNISISARNPCFGNRWQQLLINSFIGYDTILMNSLLNARGEGYLYNFQTKELYDLKYLHDSSGVPNSFEGYIVSKSGVLIMSLFVFFTTTMSVSFTLRETQARMLKFTVQLQYHARHRLPTFRLIFIHVIESLVFVPIMIGISFFLFEFYGDQLLAFMVLTLVWLCELFTMISVRTPMSMQYFPRFFLLYFLAFHIYFFSYEYGFSYLAFSTTAAFMQHLVLYFWNHFEVPALQRFLRARTLLQQQSGVQITSSAIITSTFHIARLRPAGASTGAEADSRLSVLSSVRENVPSYAANPGIVSYRANISSNSTPVEGSDTESVGVDSIRDFGVRLGDEIFDGGGRISSRTINSRNASVVANEDMSTSGRDRDGETDTYEGTNPQGSEPGLHSSQSTNHLMQPSHLSSFGSLLLWILGGTSENLVSIFPVFRDLRDQGLNRGNFSGHNNEDGDSGRSSNGASGSSEGLRQRSGYTFEDTERT